MNEDGVSKGVLYCLMMDLEYSDSRLTIRGFFEENSPTGTRESAVFEFRGDDLGSGDIRSKGKICGCG